jgi:hypothetical protein
MDGEVIQLSYLMAILIGWFSAKDKYAELLVKEKELHRTLALQTLYLNGKGTISSEDFDVHDRVAKEVQDLADANSDWLHSQIRVEIIDD